MNFSENEIDYWMNEDLPYFDLTTEVLGIGGLPGKISFVTRERTVVCGTEEVRRIFDGTGMVTKNCLPSGTDVPENTVIIAAEGNAGQIHSVWKVCVNILEYASGIATRTRSFVKMARDADPEINVAVTRKVFPGTKKLSTKATLCGGAVPHRLGLSETVLIFDEHIRFLDGLKNLPEKLAGIRKFTDEKKIEVEVHNLDDALFIAGLAVDIIQVDKMPPGQLAELVVKVRRANPLMKIAVAGGITSDNVGEYAKTGVDIIVTSALYSGKTSDIKVVIEAC
jgi:molybdenum transport protein